MRSGIMNGTLDDGLPSASITRPNGCFSVSVKVRSLTTSSEASSRITSVPDTSFAPQRLIDATQSAAVTGAPSCHFRPWRSVNVYVFLSGESVYVSIICGLTWPLESTENSVS